MKRVVIVDDDNIVIRRPLNLSETADLLGVSTGSLKRWTISGRIPAGAWFYTPGGHRRFHRAAIEEFLARGGAR